MLTLDWALAKHADLRLLGIQRSALSALPRGVSALRSKESRLCLTNHSRWWFNALRIGRWGAKRVGFEAFGQYSIKQIDESLSKLDSVHRIQSKPGKKGLVYKSL